MLKQPSDPADFQAKATSTRTQSSLGFLPVPESDFIFAAIVEELGFLGGFLIILLFRILPVSYLENR